MRLEIGTSEGNIITDTSEFYQNDLKSNQTITRVVKNERMSYDSPQS
jgi:hypothetical protein